MDTNIISKTEAQQLTVNEYGSLCYPTSAGAPMVILHYPAGDIDTFKASDLNLDVKEFRGKLAQALFDGREVGYLPNVSEVILPNGDLFKFDEHVGEYEFPSMEGWWY